MQRKGICYTGYVSTERWQLITHQVPNQIQCYAYRVQQIFSSFFSKAGMKGDEYDIITAILLGNDDTMEPELKNAYAAAGVSHILCVSGMHVGIIFMIVNFLLKPLELFKQTRIVKSFLLLAIIWVYAHITGLSPSVCRAATMFTFVTIGEWGHRNTNTFHSLFTSLFILLLIKPLLLFELGFQLSYLAVFGIVFCQKPLSCVYFPKTKVGHYVWQLVTVSVAAQLATFPLSVYYFGQFPNYFLLANLSVITLSFVVVLTGILLLAVSCVSFLNAGVAWLLNGEIKIMNLIIRTIEGFPGAVMRNISVTEFEVLLLYLFFFLLFIAFIWKKKKVFFASLLVLLSYSVSKVYDKMHYMAQENHTFYSIPNILAINFNDHGNSILLSDSITDKKHRQYSFCIQNHERKEYIQSLILPLDSLCFQNDFLCKRGNFICFEGKKFYILAAHQKLFPVKEKIKVDYLIIRGNPSISLKKVREAIEFSEILINENNSHYYFNKYMNIR
ncbi:MAG: ComEC/Rec2 family competence protein, partial [Bacteroidales bacterium]